MWNTGLAVVAVDEGGSQAKEGVRQDRPATPITAQASRVVALGRLDGENPCPTRPIDNLVVWPSIRAPRRIKSQARNLR